MPRLARAIIACGALLALAACGADPDEPDADPDGAAPPADAALDAFDAATRDPDAGSPSRADAASTDAAGDGDGSQPVDDAGTARADASATPDAGPSCPPTERDLWVWDDSVATDPTARQALFAFAAERGIRAIYVQSGALLRRDDDLIETFTVDARDRCLTVDLLLGDPRWARASEHDAALELVDRAVTVASAAATRPRGVHLDVEPYTLPEWETDRESIARQFVELLEAVAAALDGSGLELVVDAAFWYDEVSVDAGEGARPLSELVQDIADRTVIMAYRDHASPPDGIVDHSADELAYASAIGRPLVVGVETLCGLEPERVTFCEEGEAALEAELVTARAALFGEAGFGGFAIHHYVSYRDLVP